jgi:SAM-dependent methyltransferase
MDKAGRRINFGSGQFPQSGWINVDVDPHAPADVRHDFEQFPYPFENDSADAITASHVLEHLRQPFCAMREFARILRPGGVLTLRVPHFSRGFTHADHKCGFDVSFPLYFDPAFRGGYSGVSLHHRSTTLRWFAQPELKRLTLGNGAATFGAALGAVIDRLAAVSPYFASRVWCFWVGGFEEIEFVFTRPPRQHEPSGTNARPSPSPG